MPVGFPEAQKQDLLNTAQKLGIRILSVVEVCLDSYQTHRQTPVASLHASAAVSGDSITPTERTNWFYVVELNDDSTGEHMASAKVSLLNAEGVRHYLNFKPNL